MFSFCCVPCANFFGWFSSAVHTTVVFGIRYWLRPILRTLLHGNLQELDDRIGKLTSPNSSLEENVSDMDCEGKVLEEGWSAERAPVFHKLFTNHKASEPP